MIQARASVDWNESRQNLTEKRRAAVMLFLSGAFLFYTATIVPVQLCLWTYDDPCNIFPTLQFDVIVDTFFLVICHGECEGRMRVGSRYYEWGGVESFSTAGCF
jgi:hypothetical protein